MTIARRTSIAIVGGGIGGLAAAALLLRAGFDVQVYEQTKTLGEVGAGINIGPNASRILHRLGIADVLSRASVKPLSFDQRRWDDGRLLLRSPLGEAVETAFGAPYYTLHRGDLHRALTDIIPSGHVHVGQCLTHLVDHGDRVEAHFANGASISADALVGADGIHSVVRNALFGPEKPRFTGCVAYATTGGGLPFGLPTQWLKGNLSWRPHARLVTGHEMGRRSTSRLFHRNRRNARVAGPVLHASNAI